MRNANFDLHYNVAFRTYSFFIFRPFTLHAYSSSSCPPPHFRASSEPRVQKTMLILLHGDNSFSSTEKLTQTRERFEKTHGRDSIVTLDGKSIEIGALRDMVKQMPLWSKKRMVLVREFFASKPTAELVHALALLLTEIPEHTVLLFYESTKIKGGGEAFKVLQKKAHVEECTALSPAAAQKWVANRAEQLGTNISSRTAASLIEVVGPDLWKVSHELEKLSLFAGDAEITEEMLATLVSSTVTSNVFHLVESIGRRDPRQSLLELQKLRATGAAAIYLLTMVVYHFRSVIQARDILNRGKGKAELVRDAHLHPFAAEKALAEAKHFTLSQLIEIYNRLASIDRNVKRGLVDADTALDHFIMTVA